MPMATVSNSSAPRRFPSLVILMAATFAGACASAARVPAPAPAPVSAPVTTVSTRSPIAAAQQLLLVITPGFDATTGTAQRFERGAAGWRAVAEPNAVVVGRTGLAWGDASAAGPGQPVKHEGDGRAPAGAFPVDTLFGFAAHGPASAAPLPWYQLTTRSDCVDDERSAHYNTVVDSNRVTRVDWTSAEHMRSIEQYRIGAIVGYNAPPVLGRGSCIFLHVWAGPQSVTAGCTAMDASVLQSIMEWMDRSRRPMLVQLPRAEYARLRAVWGLPDA